MAYRLGTRSKWRLRDVHLDLHAVVSEAIKRSSVDFTVLEGRRSKQRQAELVRVGASKTLNSRHITGHAVDLGAWVGSRVRWDWPLYFLIAEAMREASRVTKVPIRWGGCWDRELLLCADTMEAECAGYQARRKAMGKRAFIDGPHFELPRDGSQ